MLTWIWAPSEGHQTNTIPELRSQPSHVCRYCNKQQGFLVKDVAVQLALTGQAVGLDFRMSCSPVGRCLCCRPVSVGHTLTGGRVSGRVGTFLASLTAVIQWPFYQRACCFQRVPTAETWARLWEYMDCLLRRCLVALVATATCIWNELVSINLGCGWFHSCGFISCCLDWRSSSRMFAPLSLGLGDLSCLVLFYTPYSQLIWFGDVMSNQGFGHSATEWWRKLLIMLRKLHIRLWIHVLTSQNVFDNDSADFEVAFMQMFWKRCSLCHKWSYFHACYFYSMLCNLNSLSVS